MAGSFILPYILLHLLVHLDQGVTKKVVGDVVMFFNDLIVPGGLLLSAALLLLGLVQWLRGRAYSALVTWGITVITSILLYWLAVYLQAQASDVL